MRLCSTTRTYTQHNTATKVNARYRLAAVARTYLSKSTFADSSMELKVIQVDLRVEVNRFGETAAHNQTMNEARSSIDGSRPLDQTISPIYTEIESV